MRVDSDEVVRRRMRNVRSEVDETLKHETHWIGDDNTSSCHVMYDVELPRLVPE